MLATFAFIGFPSGSDSLSLSLSAVHVDLGFIPGLERSPIEENGNPLQYSCLENSMDGGAWWATVHGVAKSWTRLSDITFSFFPVFLPGKSHRWRNLAGYSPWGRKESDTTERLHFAFMEQKRCHY